MQDFLAKIPAASTTVLDLNHYSYVAGSFDYGRMRKEAGVIQDVRISCVDADARGELLASPKRMVDGIDGDSGTLTYMAFLSLDDDVGARIFGRWRTRDDLERFIRREAVIGFWMENKEHVRAMEQRLYVPNGKGWLHCGSGYAGEKGAQSEQAKI
jgi:quinol monooxygenase YgiN